MREAKQRAALLDETLKAVAPGRLVRLWLMQLALVRASNKPLDDVRAQIDGIAGLLDFPPVLFTQDTLREAAERVEYPLDYRHLSAFLRDKLRALEVERERCRVLCRPTREQGQEATAPAKTPEVMRLYDAYMAAWRAGDQTEMLRLADEMKRGGDASR